jgi:hypothetical protein
MRMRPAAAGAALIEYDDSVARRVKKAARVHIAPTAGAAVNEYCRNTLGIAALLVIQRVSVADVEISLGVRLDGVEKLAQRHV